MLGESKSAIDANEGKKLKDWGGGVISVEAEVANFKRKSKSILAQDEWGYRWNNGMNACKKRGGKSGRHGRSYKRDKAGVSLRGRVFN